MSRQPWEEEDLLTLIEWVASESISAIQSGEYYEAYILQAGASAIILIGSMIMTADSRVNTWLRCRMSFNSLLREFRQGRMIEVDARNEILKSLELLSNFVLINKLNEVARARRVDEKLVLPESFDESSIFW
ncbi:MAG: hypothetical protein ACK53K_08300 [Burkholderiales bacterium]